MASSRLIMSSEGAGTALSTLASATAVLLSSTVDTEMDAPFLVKQIQLHCGWHDADPTDGIIVGFAQGDATIAEIASALFQPATDPFDVGESAPVFKKNLIFWETLRYLSSEMNVVNDFIKIGGGKGIPIAEIKGINFFALNIGPALLTTGSLLNHHFTLKGVWLGD